VCTGNENSKPIWNKFINRKYIIETSQVVLNFCRTVYIKIICSKQIEGSKQKRVPPWPWSYDSWFHNYLFYQCLSPLMFESWSGRGVQHYAIEFVSYMRRISGFLRVLQFPSPRKTDRHDIAKILLKVALNTIKQTNKQSKQDNANCVVRIYNWFYVQFKQ
jgi:hypothetical protein